jgi:hypothetical protein
VHKRIISAVKEIGVVSDRISYIILGSRWCHIIVLNIHVPTEDKTDDVMDSFYEELDPDLTRPEDMKCSKHWKKNNLKHLSSGEPTYWPSDRSKLPDLVD